MAQVPDNLRSRAEKLSGRWLQKCPPHMRNRGNDKEIVSEYSKSPLYHSRGFLELVGRRVFLWEREGMVVERGGHQIS